MARQGRSMELLIEMLEKANSGNDIQIISPGYLKDKLTNENREVDILLLTEVGTSTVRIAIECRDRKARQDTTWIEQIDSKYRYLEVNKVITVSSNGFTKPALKKAGILNIETRTISEVDPESVKTWWNINSIKIVGNTYNILETHVRLKGQKDINMQRQLLYSEKIFHDKRNEKKYSVNDLFNQISGKITDWNGLLPGMTPLVKPYRILFDESEPLYFQDSDNEMIPLRHIDLLVELFVFSRSEPIKRATVYENENKTISHLFEYCNEALGEHAKLELIRNQKGIVTVRIDLNN